MKKSQNSKRAETVAMFVKVAGMVTAIGGLAVAVGYMVNSLITGRTPPAAMVIGLCVGAVGVILINGVILIKIADDILHPLNCQRPETSTRGKNYTPPRGPT
jgi:purine-cytosine permease-like protein